MGKKQGFADDRGFLFFEVVRILKDKKSPVFVLENVKQLATHNQGQTLKTILGDLTGLGYKAHWKVLNVLDYGLPQKRERPIIVGFLDHTARFTFPEPIPRINLE